MSGEYIMVHIRSPDMSADIHTKGFLIQPLSRKPKLLTNSYIPEEFEKGRLNGPPVNDKGKEQPVDFTMGIHTQYSIIILSGPNSAKSAKKAIKLNTMVKAKAKAKPNELEAYTVGYGSCRSRRQGRV